MNIIIAIYHINRFTSQFLNIMSLLFHCLGQILIFCCVNCISLSYFEIVFNFDWRIKCILQSNRQDLWPISCSFKLKCIGGSLFLIQNVKQILSCNLWLCEVSHKAVYDRVINVVDAMVIYNVISACKNVRAKFRQE